MAGGRKRGHKIGKILLTGEKKICQSNLRDADDGSVGGFVPTAKVQCPKVHCNDDPLETDPPLETNPPLETKPPLPTHTTPKTLTQKAPPVQKAPTVIIDDTRYEKR